MNETIDAWVMASVGLRLPALLAMFALERIVPARKMPAVKHWYLKGVLFFILSAFVSTFVSIMVAKAFEGRSLVDLSGLGTLGGAAFAYVVTDLVAYWTHRGLHKFDWAWRWTHQMHHSPERVDMFGQAYSHPFDVAVQVGAVAVTTALLGISVPAAVLAATIGSITSPISHLNVRTPQWLGYFVGRPEGHAIHHTRGVHGYNYCHFPFWDIVFGTFKNPKDFPEASTEYGFWDGASEKVGAILAGQDVSNEPTEQTDRGVIASHTVPPPG